ncbi:unnamed protein product [Citrullus colocynthis]|uniref:Uncharacterized protein n=1 Tax=Citrullus colocynthis TaxID=252529 RepID=A0ABP0YKY0_9ROSI
MNHYQVNMSLHIPASCVGVESGFWREPLSVLAGFKFSHKVISSWLYKEVDIIAFVLTYRNSLSPFVLELFKFIRYLANPADAEAAQAVVEEHMKRGRVVDFFVQMITRIWEQMDFEPQH